jgi:hypothetical protein
MSSLFNVKPSILSGLVVAALSAAAYAAETAKAAAAAPAAPAAAAAPATAPAPAAKPAAPAASPAAPAAEAPAAAAPAAAKSSGTACEEVKASIDAKLKAKGVKAYTLDAVPAAEVKDAKVVGTCEAGAKKIVYKKG